MRRTDIVWSVKGLSKKAKRDAVDWLAGACGCEYSWDYSRGEIEEADYVAIQEMTDIGRIVVTTDLLDTVRLHWNYQLPIHEFNSKSIGEM